MLEKFVRKITDKLIARLDGELFDQRYLDWKASVFRNTSYPCFTFSLTTRCNFGCPFCLRNNIDQGKTLIRDLPVPVFRTVLEEGKKLNGRYVSLTGGEPILHPAFPELLDLLAHYGYKFTIISNGWLYRDYFPVLEKHRANLEIIRFSLGGTTAEVHDGSRKKPGSFEKVLEAIRFYREKGLPVGANFTVDAGSYHQLEAAAGLCAGAGAMMLKYINVIPYDPSLAPACLDAGKRAEAVRTIRRIHEKYGSKFLVQLSNSFYSIPGPGPGGAAVNVCPVLDGRSLYVDSDGGMLFCCDIHRKCANGPMVREAGFERSLSAVWDASNKMRQKFLGAILAGDKEEPGFCEFCNRNVNGCF